MATPPQHPAAARPRQRYKAVIFDLGGVVMASPIEGIAAYERLHPELPLNFVNATIAGWGSEGAFSRYERGEVEFDEFIRTFKAELESPRAVKLYRAYCERKGVPSSDLPDRMSNVDTLEIFRLMMSKAAEPHPEFLHALTVLRGSGITTCALTNNFKMPSRSVVEDEMPLGRLSHFFDHIVESSKVGMRKPDPRIFHYTLDLIGAEARETCFLDDIGYNAKAGRDVGMTTIKVGLHKGREALRELGEILGLSLLPSLNPGTPVTLWWNMPTGRWLVGDMFGSGANPPVIMLHGGGQTRHSWGQFGPALARAGFCAIALDQKGHGDSAWDLDKEDDRRYTPFSYSLELDHFLQASKLGDRRPILVGASLGGLASLGSAFSQRGEIGALVLVDIVMKMAPKGVHRVLGFMKESAAQGFASPEDAMLSVAKYNPDRASGSKQKDSSSEGLMKNLRHSPVTGRYYWHWDPEFVDLALPKHESAPVEEGLVVAEMVYDECAKHIRGYPVLLVRGKQTDIVSMEGVLSLQEKIPHAKFVDIDDAGHMIAGDKNDVFSTAVLVFATSKEVRERVLVPHPWSNIAHDVLEGADGAGDESAPRRAAL